ncbi:hypothetical protein B0T26DRAFT_97536 [Lasiosphaeria miniovina]|uniref:Uncharacterized protein n=1 Tax=Lasiosphaeria miniovina TaxID=1954250 RepID=A0AA40BJB2_9PEZI|nr:uncharacterized protein B0T26DRAFT_97536 [Lasiosphaeria miniovina]KAK0735173.1 hypothetical protein B0T26DRAFT_97536 [Lasiosphaeria miniovina]
MPGRAPRSPDERHRDILVPPAQRPEPTDRLSPRLFPSLSHPRRARLSSAKTQPDSLADLARSIHPELLLPHILESPNPSFHPSLRRCSLRFNSSTPYPHLPRTYRSLRSNQATSPPPQCYNAPAPCLTLRRKHQTQTEGKPLGPRQESGREFRHPNLQAL